MKSSKEFSSDSYHELAQLQAELFDKYMREREFNYVRITNKMATKAFAEIIMLTREDKKAAREILNYFSRFWNESTTEKIFDETWKTLIEGSDGSN